MRVECYHVTIYSSVSVPHFCGTGNESDVSEVLSRSQLHTDRTLMHCKLLHSTYSVLLTYLRLRLRLRLRLTDE